MKSVFTIILISIILNTSYSQNQKYENLVFEGAGIRETDKTI